MSDPWSEIIEKDGKIQVKPRIGFAIPAPDRLTASKIAMALDTAYTHGREGLQASLRNLLGIEEGRE